MPFQSIEPRRLYRQIADQIRTLIRSGEFPAGARLPPERDLAKQLGVSRPSVREALIALDAETGKPSAGFGTGGATVFAGKRGAPDRSQWWVKRGSKIIFRDLKVRGSHPNGGLSKGAYVRKLETQHGFKIEGVQGANLFTLKTGPLEAALRDLGTVQSARVTVQLPNTLAVAIKERTAVMVWKVGERRYLAAADLHVTEYSAS